MRILFLTDNFPPEVNAPASRTFEHCREWVRVGHQVTVITGAPNFPTGKVFPGYRNRIWQRETMDGIEVVRVWTYITANSGFAKRTLDYLSFMLSGGIAGLFQRRPDVIVGTSPQFFTNCAAWVLSIFRWRPFVFELRDLWPESIKTVGAMQDSMALRAMERLERFLYRRAAAVVAVTESFKRNLISRGIGADKIHVVTNGVDLRRFMPLDGDQALRAELGIPADAFVAGYIGTHGMAHALETVLEAAQRIKRETDPFSSRVRFILLGDGARKAALQQAAAGMGLDNVLFLDTVPKAEVPQYWSLLDVSIIHLRKADNFTQVIPSKLFECMGMGIPVLHGVAGESAGIVEREGVGLVHASLHKQLQDQALFSDRRSIRHLFEFTRLCALPEAETIDWARTLARLDRLGVGDALRVDLLSSYHQFGQSVPPGVQWSATALAVEGRFWLRLNEPDLDRQMARRWRISQAVRRLRRLPQRLISKGWLAAKLRHAYVQWKNRRLAKGTPLGE